MTLFALSKKMPGPRAPAFFVSLAALAMALPAQAQQQQPTVQVPASQVPVPGQLELSKMLWSTLLAVDQANQSGNYSVLRDIASQGFQIRNNPAALAQIFTGLRNSRIDLSNALLVPPTYLEPPRLVAENVLQVRSLFQIRPSAIQIEVYYAWEQGRWKLHGVDVQPLQMATAP